MTSAADRSVVCVDAWDISIDGDVVVGRARDGLRAWSRDAGLALWRADDSPIRFACEGGEVHLLRWSDEDPSVLVRDARTGAARREVALDDVDADQLSNLFAVLDGEYLLAPEDALQRRSLAGGALVAEAPAPGLLRAWAWTSSTLCVASERGYLAGFERATLARRWIREDLGDAELRAAGDLLIASFDALVALDARSGRERWRSEVFTEALDATDDAVLARGQRGWVALLDARTGQVRWRQRAGPAVVAAAREVGGFAVLTRDALIRYDDNGVERGRWEVEAPYAVAASSVAGAALVCAATRVGARVDGAGAPPLLTPAALEVQPPRAPEALPGRSPFTPSHARLDEARAILREVDDLDEAWEALAVRGVIPGSWIDDPTRRFEARGTPTAWVARPWSRGAMLAFAADVEGVARAEALWRESLRRFAPWPHALDETCRWGAWRPELLWNIDGAFNPPVRDGALPPPVRDAREALHVALPPEALAAIDAEAARRSSREADYPHRRDLLAADAAWRTAARAGVALHVGGAPRRIDEARSPYEPLCEIVATGYLVDGNGVLRARCFDAPLERFEGVDDDIPF